VFFLEKHTGSEFRVASSEFNAKSCFALKSYAGQARNAKPETVVLSTSSFNPRKSGERPIRLDDRGDTACAHRNITRGRAKVSHWQLKG